ncbi:finTRIM family, member 86 [Siphateles boraxobius]|uniref:finTRIM family, member 86 n=1 Tax=Siphateles boraxobius TaxID=180520 RepID=UPI0040642D37
MYFSQYLYLPGIVPLQCLQSGIVPLQCLQSGIVPLQCIPSAMASAAWAPEAFACPICLETLSDPATLPCGHTYCLLCIQKHWDHPSTPGSCECPQCRQRFTPRPVLARSNVLMEALEKLRLSEESAEAPRLYPALPTGSPAECGLLGHTGRPDQQQHKIQQELIALSAGIQESIADRERVIQSLPQASQAHEVSLQRLTLDCQAVFEDVSRSVELSRSQVLEMLHTHERSLSTHTQAHTLQIQQEIVQLRQKLQQIQRLQRVQDPDTLLTAFEALDGVCPPVSAALEVWSPQPLISGVRSSLEALQTLTHASLAAVIDAAALAQSSSQSCDPGLVSSQSQPPSLNPAFQITEVKSDSAKPDVKPKVKASSPATQEHHTNQGSANPVEGSASCCLDKPAPKTREEMLKFRTELTLDPNSAFRQIRLSDGYRKATLCVESQNYPAHADRFVFWRQVMCAEPLAGSPSYWELEWTGHRVTVGVAYKDMDRSSAEDSARLGHNTHSWSLYWSGKAFSLWHAGRETALAGPKARRVGVYVDQQAGVLAFYRVSHRQAQEICCIHTHFQGPLFASFRFWSGVGSSVTICELN